MGAELETKRRRMAGIAEKKRRKNDGENESKPGRILQ